MVKKDGMILEKQHKGRLHPSFLRRVSVPCEGNRKGRKAYFGLVRMWSSLWLKGDGGIRKDDFFNGKEGRVGFRKNNLNIIIEINE